MKFELTKEQAKHLESIRWLFSGPRGSGRTTLIAYVLIETVLITGEDMRIHDHHNSAYSDRYLVDIIDRIILQEKLPLKINRSGMYLTYSK